MLSNFFEALYNKVFINIVVKRNNSSVYVELCSKKGVVEHFEDNFATTKLNNEMLEYILSYTKESPYHYISILDASKEQGAMPTCDRNKFSLYCEFDEIEYKCHESKWLYYTSKTNMYNIAKTYQNIGIDMIFSPFSIVSNFFQDKIGSHLAMYVLVQEDSISLSVFKNSKLVFGEQIDMQNLIISDESLLNDDIELDLDDDISLDDGINLDDIDIDNDVEDIDDLEDFSDIEDLDTIEDIDEFSKTQDIEEKLHDIEEIENEIDEDGFNEDYERFSFIKTSLSNFYNNEKYEGEFIENIYIADSVGVSAELKRYLEEEMFLNVYIRHIELNYEVAKLAKLEIEL